MSLYMPPHLFRLTNFRLPPKVELGLDGKAGLVYVWSIKRVFIADILLEPSQKILTELSNPRWKNLVSFAPFPELSYQPNVADRKPFRREPLYHDA